VNAAKIAAIVSHAAFFPVREEARRCAPDNSLLGRKISLFGSAKFSVPFPAKLADDPASL
jgi:hypothetical protein